MTHLLVSSPITNHIYDNNIHYMKRVINLNNRTSKFVENIYDVQKSGKDRKDSYTFSYTKDGKIVRQTFTIYIDLMDKDPLVIGIYITGEDYSYCLSMSFAEPKPIGKYYGFKTSYIYHIDKNKCGTKNNKFVSEFTGNYTINLANKLNDLLQVEKSTLQDASYINSWIDLKILNIYLYNKSWYHRVGGYIPTDNIYELYDNSTNITLDELYPYINEGKDRVDKTNKILAEMSLKPTDTIVKIVKSLFKSGLTKDDTYVWRTIMNTSIYREMTVEIRYKNLIIDLSSKYKKLVKQDKMFRIVRDMIDGDILDTGNNDHSVWDTHHIFDKIMKDRQITNVNVINFFKFMTRSKYWFMKQESVRIRTF